MDSPLERNGFERSVPRCGFVRVGADLCASVIRDLARLGEPIELSGSPRSRHSQPGSAVSHHGHAVRPHRGTEILNPVSFTTAEGKRSVVARAGTMQSDSGGDVGTALLCSIQSAAAACPVRAPGAHGSVNRQSSRRDGLYHLNRRSPSPNSSHAAPCMISSMAISVPSTQRPDQGRVM